MNFLATASLITAAILLSACGGSSTGGSVFTSTGPVAVDDLNKTAATNPLLNVTDLVAKGSASYSGLIIGDLGTGGDALVGRTRINANFGDGGSLTGNITDFALVSGGTLETEEVAPDAFRPIPADAKFTQLDGELTLSNGRIANNNGVAIISIGVAGDVTVPASLIQTIETGEENFAVTGEVVAAVSSNGELIGAGLLNGAGATTDIAVDTRLFAK